jgi:periplasmic divalent cation tolerance protein
MTDARIVFTTAGSAFEADKLALALVERRLAACVNIIPQIRSIYRWQEKVEQASEWLLVIKTESSAYERLRDAITELHSYEVPECIMLEVSNGNKPYLEWITQNVS